MINTDDYPVVDEFLTDSSGQIRKVVLQVHDYQRLIAALEDDGLYRAMQAVKDETPLSRDEALRELES